MVYVAASADGYVVGEELEGDDFEDGEQELGGGGDVDDVLDRFTRAWFGVARAGCLPGGRIRVWRRWMDDGGRGDGRRRTGPAR